MFQMRIGWLAALGCLGAAVLNAQAGAHGILLVLSKGDQTLAMVDPQTQKVLARMPSGPDPHEVVASPDGRFAYISNYGGGAYSTITVVDLEMRKTLPAIELSPLRAPHGLDYVGGKVWFTAETNKVIGTYDPAAHKVDWILGTGQNRTHMIKVASGLDRIFTTNVNSATVSIIDKVAAGGRGGRGGPPGAPQFDWNETVVPVGRGAEGFDVSPNGKELWTADAQDGTISVIDLAAKRAVETIPANVGSANRLKFTRDGKLAFVSMLNNADVAIFDAATRREVKRVKIGRGAAGIEMEPGGARAYVSCTPDDYVTVIDLKRLEVAGHIDAGKQPDGLWWISGR